jgi:hypothetical protein
VLVAIVLLLHARAKKIREDLEDKIREDLFRGLSEFL